MSINTLDGSKFTGQVIGVYNERPFMWHPKNRDTLALFKCNYPQLGLDTFNTFPISSNNAIFTLNTDEISAIQIVQPPENITTYIEYLRNQDITLKHQTVKVINNILGFWDFFYIFVLFILVCVL